MSRLWYAVVVIVTIIWGLVASSTAAERGGSPAAAWAISIGFAATACGLKWISTRPEVPCSRPQAALKFVKSYAIGTAVATSGIMGLRVWFGATNRVADDIPFFAVLIGIPAFIIAYPIYRLAYKGPERWRRATSGQVKPKPATPLALPHAAAAPLPRRNELARRDSGFAVRGAGTGRLAEGGPLYARSAEAAATIVNLCLHSDLPVTQLFGSIQLYIIEAMERVSDDLGECRSR
jgi:hypothetical protein